MLKRLARLEKVTRQLENLLTAIQTHLPEDLNRKVWEIKESINHISQ